MSPIVKQLNDTVWATIKPSPVHGVGVFAIRDIPKGQRIYAVGRSNEWLHVYDETAYIHPAILKIILQRWPLAFEGQPFQSPNDDVRLTSFLNHSSDPNYDYHTDCATRDIKEGEEIFECYPHHLTNFTEL